MSNPGNNPPTGPRSGRMGALRDSYGRAKMPKETKEPAGERRPWYKLRRPAK